MLLLYLLLLPPPPLLLLLLAGYTFPYLFDESQAAAKAYKAAATAAVHPC
jgi:hypothetical protein